MLVIKDTSKLTYFCKSFPEYKQAILDKILNTPELSQLCNSARKLWDEAYALATPVVTQTAKKSTHSTSAVYKKFMVKKLLLDENTKQAAWLNLLDNLKGEGVVAAQQAWDKVRGLTIIPASQPPVAIVDEFKGEVQSSSRRMRS